MEIFNSDLNFNSLSQVEISSQLNIKLLSKMKLQWPKKTLTLDENLILDRRKFLGCFLKIKMATSQTRFKWIDNKLINFIKYLQELIHYDELRKMWDGSPASKPLSYWTSTICINYNMNADDFPDNIRSSSSNSLSNNSPFNYGHSSN